jgi:hypothetical protein
MSVLEACSGQKMCILRVGRHHVSAECINPMLINLGSNSFYASKINGQWFGRCGSWVAENSQDVFSGLIN